MRKIDEIDAKILKDLLQDGRKSFDDIANECNVSKNKIWKCYMQMKKAGIIVGATIQMNYASLGYVAIATILLNIESQHVESVFERLKKIPEVLAIRQFNSRYNVRLIVNLKNLKELDQIKQTIRFHSSVVDIRTYFWLDVMNNPENLSFGFPKNLETILNQKPSKTSGIPEKITIDETDKQITEKLSEDGRKSFRKIAEETGLSTDTVIRRYERLVKSGAMKVSIQINPEKLGYQANLDFSIAFAFQKETSKIVENLSKIPDVIIILKTSGDYDLHVTAMVRDTKQQFEIQEEIAKIPNIMKMETAARRIPNKWPTNSQHISTF
jgi:Lrp/AsnC family transcriptional regulator for asnA, asnC and gidA